MAETAQYATRRRKRGRCLFEFLVLATVVTVLVLLVCALAVIALVYGAESISLWGGLVVLGAGGAVLWLWLWVTNHWDGRRAEELAHEGRRGRVRNVETADRVLLHVEVEDPAEADHHVTVILCHAIGSSASAWRHQRAALVAEGIRVVSYDMRGHGKSDSAKLDQSVRGMRQLADDLGRVIDATAPEGYVVIAGHSAGAMTAMALAAVRPALLQRIGGFVFCSASAGPVGAHLHFGVWRIFAPLSALMRRQAIGAFRALDVLPRFVARLLSLAPYELGMRFLAVDRRNSATAVRPSAAILYENGFRQSGDLLAAFMDHDERQVLEELGAAYVSVVAGEQDRIVHLDEQASLADSIPEATLRSVPQCGHQILFEAPDVVTEELLGIALLVRDRAGVLVGSTAGADGVAAPRQRGASPRHSASAPANPSTTGREPAEANADGTIASSIGEIRDAFGDLLDAVEDTLPGPVRGGVHTVNRLIGGERRRDKDGAE